jgi:hypothetical protein
VVCFTRFEKEQKWSKRKIRIATDDSDRKTRSDSSQAGVKGMTQGKGVRPFWVYWGTIVRFSLTPKITGLLAARRRCG